MTYKGFTIETSNGDGNTWHYRIFKDGKAYSKLCLRTIKAGIRVIDTYLKAIQNV